MTFFPIGDYLTSFSQGGHAMAYDLRRVNWIPWRRRSGAVDWGPPATLVDDLRGDPVVAIAAPRPDFNGALQELLIGLLAVALQPEDDDAWLERWNAPPTADELQAAFDALPPAFDLDGDGARFFQDHSAEDLADWDVIPIGQMLIDAPGEQTMQRNTDLFIKRGRVARLCRPSAAMALVTLQTYAPTGGQGHRTSLRGGGPLTTLVDPRVDGAGDSLAHQQPLWQKLWANVPTADQWRGEMVNPGTVRPADVFPWLAPTRISDPRQGRKTTPADAHPLQAFFGTPRRIRLELSGPGPCDLTGREDERTVVGFRMRTYGVQCLEWRHPLSPYYRPSGKDEWLAVHGQSGGVGWRDWLALTLRAPEADRRVPARTVVAFSGRSRQARAPYARLHAFGYVLDQMKAADWVEASLPVFPGVDAERHAHLADAAARLTDGGGIAAAALMSAVERALFQRPEDVTGDRSRVKTELWEATATHFYEGVRRVAMTDAPAAAVDEVCRAFATTLERTAVALFDRYCFSGTADPSTIRRLVAARYSLVMTLRGYSKLGAKLFAALRIPSPDGSRQARAKRSRTRKEAST